MFPLVAVTELADKLVGRGGAVVIVIGTEVADPDVLVATIERE